jgi:hypothetical protein
MVFKALCHHHHSVVEKLENECDLEGRKKKRQKNEKIHENTSCAMMLVISRIFL